MPKKRRKSKPADHLASALESLRERPDSAVGFASDERTAALSYVVGVGTESNGKTERARPSNRRMAFNLPEELCERLRNAVWHLADRIGVNLSSLAEGVLAAEVTRLEETYNDGNPFPKRRGRLKGGAAPSARIRRGE